MNIGQRIKERRKELGMSAETLGDILGKNRSTIYRYENGFIENMPLDVLEPIANALRTTPAYLMGWDVEEIEAISNMQNDANTYDDAHEKELRDFMIEVSSDFNTKQFKRLKSYAETLKSVKVMNSGISEETLQLYIDLFEEMYSLNLSEDELNDVVDYVAFIKSKREQKG